jgi:hypothetical protein
MDSSRCGVIKMNITSAKKINDMITQEWELIQATIDGVNMSVPLDPANRHYAAIMEMVDAGELTIAEADA